MAPSRGTILALSFLTLPQGWTLREGSDTLQHALTEALLCAILERKMPEGEKSPMRLSHLFGHTLREAVGAGEIEIDILGPTTIKQLIETHQDRLGGLLPYLVRREALIALGSVADDSIRDWVIASCRADESPEVRAISERIRGGSAATTTR